MIRIYHIDVLKFITYKESNALLFIQIPQTVKFTSIFRMKKFKFRTYGSLVHSESSWDTYKVK